MRKIILFLVMSSFLFSCCMTEEEMQAEREQLYYLDEDFILVDKKEIIDPNTDASAPVKLRVWVIHRLNSPSDFVYMAEISSKTNCNSCGSDFKITDELWYNKNIGDILHFDYIRKDRFIKIDKVNISNYVNEKELNNVRINSKSIEVVTETIKPINDVDELEKERRIMEIERQIMSLERELETLK